MNIEYIIRWVGIHIKRTGQKIPKQRFTSVVKVCPRSVETFTSVVKVCPQSVETFTSVVKVCPRSVETFTNVVKV
jgi:hypothetical protein